MSSGRERSLKENLGKPAVKVKGTELGIFVSALVRFALLSLTLVKYRVHIDVNENFLICQNIPSFSSAFN